MMPKGACLNAKCSTDRATDRKISAQQIVAGVET